MSLIVHNSMFQVETETYRLSEELFCKNFQNSINTSNCFEFSLREKQKLSFFLLKLL